MSQWISKDYLLGRISLRRDGVLTKHDIETAPYAEFKWIPVSERLPDKDGTYLIRTKSGAVFIAKYYTEKTLPATRYRKTEYKRSAQWSGNRKVTEWMPLPK